MLEHQKEKKNFSYHTSPQRCMRTLNIVYTYHTYCKYFLSSKSSLNSEEVDICYTLFINAMAQKIGDLSNF